MHYELKNVQNVLGILLKNILKFRNNHFYKNFYSKNCRSPPPPICCSSIVGGEINYDNTSKNLKFGNL